MQRQSWLADGQGEKWKNGIADCGLRLRLSRKAKDKHKAGNAEKF